MWISFRCKSGGLVDHFWVQFNTHSYVACSRHKIRATIFANASDIEEHIPASHEPAPRQKQLMAGLAACMTYENRPRLAIELISTEQNSKPTQSLTQTINTFTEVTK